MKFPIVLLATLSLINSATLQEMEIPRIGQYYEDQSPQRLINRKEGIESTKSEILDGPEQLAQSQQINAKLIITGGSALRVGRQFVNNYEAKDYHPVHPNTFEAKEPKINQAKSQALHESAIASPDTAKSNQINEQALLLGQKGIFGIQETLKSTLSEPEKPNTLEQHSTNSESLLLDQNPSRQRNSKFSKKISFKSFSNRHKVRGNRMRQTLRIEPDTQEGNNILKVYQDLKDKKERFISGKRELVERSKSERIDQKQASSKQSDILFYCLLALLSAVSALPLIRLLACNKHAQQSTPISSKSLEPKIPQPPPVRKLDATV